jgi:indolepyruvate ferredoxin oxidoreductase, beta subunit
MTKPTTDILIAGVGGQGILLASEVLAAVCLAAGHDVKQSEVHGMAQRGGSVTSHVRFGPRGHSPTIERGRADILLSFELVEALRWIDHLGERGVALVNRQRIGPITVTSGAETYPEDAEGLIRGRCGSAVFLDGLAMARRAGNPRVVNSALLGVLSRHLGFEEGLWEAALRNRVPPRSFEVNWKVFLEGREVAGHPA